MAWLGPGVHSQASRRMASWSLNLLSFGRKSWMSGAVLIPGPWKNLGENSVNSLAIQWEKTAQTGATNGAPRQTWTWTGKKWETHYIIYIYIHLFAYIISYIYIYSKKSFIQHSNEFIMISWRLKWASKVRISINPRQKLLWAKKKANLNSRMVQ